MVAAVSEEVGPIDIVVNSAGITDDALVMRMKDDAWAGVLDTNLGGAFRVARAVGREMLRRRAGVIVNISSVGGLSTNPILGVYDVTKAALIHMTKQLAAELAPGVRVNCLAPGLVKTHFARALWEDGRGEEVAKAYPLQRLGEVEDVAGAALFLAADTARWITGQTWALDGGGLIAFSKTA